MWNREGMKHERKNKGDVRQESENKEACISLEVSFLIIFRIRLGYTHFNFGVNFKYPLTSWTC